MGISGNIGIGRTLSWLTRSFGGALLFLFVSQGVHGEGWAQPASTSTPAPLHGVIDLKGYQLEDDLTIPLNGDWFLTWDKLLKPKPWAVLKTEATGTIPVPSNWYSPSPKSRFSDSSAPIAPTGKATYFLRVINHSGPLPGVQDTGRL